MKKILICFSVIVTLLHLYSCSSTNEVYNSWLGSHKSTLIKQWGPPTRYESDGNGGEILIYEKKPVMSNYKYEGQKSAGTEGAERARERMSRMVHFTDMYVNANGIIYHWRNGMR
jgi:hypothetical protein